MNPQSLASMRTFYLNDYNNDLEYIKEVFFKL